MSTLWTEGDPLWWSRAWCPCGRTEMRSRLPSLVLAWCLKFQIPVFLSLTLIINFKVCMVFTNIFFCLTSKHRIHRIFFFFAALWKGLGISISKWWFWSLKSSDRNKAFVGWREISHCLQRGRERMVLQCWAAQKLGSGSCQQPPPSFFFFFFANWLHIYMLPMPSLCLILECQRSQSIFPWSPLVWLLHGKFFLIFKQSGEIVEYKSTSDQINSDQMLPLDPLLCSFSSITLSLVFSVFSPPHA